MWAKSALDFYTGFWRNWADHSLTGLCLDTLTHNMLRAWYLPNTLMVDITAWQDLIRKSNLCRPD